MSSGSMKFESEALGRQLALSLPDAPPDYSGGAFIRSQSNEPAWRACEAWLDSSEPALIICGPAGSGKTHLAHVIAERFDCAFFDAEKFSEEASSEKQFIVVDNMPASQPRPFLTNLETTAAAGKRLILTGREHPSDWARGLKDLRTRLEAMPRAVLDEPDEMLIEALISKAFRDRQVVVSPETIRFAALRLPRTFAAAHAFVMAADRVALEEKRKITTPFVQKFLDKLSEAEMSA